MKKSPITANSRQKAVVSKLRKLSGKYSAWQIWCDFIVLAALEVSNSFDLLNRPKRIEQASQLRKRYTEQEFSVMAEMLAEVTMGMEENPDQDFLGELFMACEFGNDAGGQFFTPYNICAAMAKMNVSDELKAKIEDKGFVAVNDCAAGAGALLVAFANECRKANINYQQSVLFVAQEIDYVTACMCYLQLSFLGCPGYVYINNTLTHPCVTVDSRGLLPIDTDNTFFTPMYFSEFWAYRKFAAKMDSMMNKSRKRDEVHESAEKVQEIEEKTHEIKEKCESSHTFNENSAQEPTVRKKSKGNSKKPVPAETKSEETPAVELTERKGGQLSFF